MSYPGIFVPLFHCPMINTRWPRRHGASTLPMQLFWKTKQGQKLKPDPRSLCRTQQYQVPLFKLYRVGCIPNKENRTILSLNRLLVRGWGARFTKGPYKMPAEREKCSLSPQKLFHVKLHDHFSFCLSSTPWHPSMY